MKLKDGGTAVLIAVVLLGVVGYFSSRFLGDDNIVEETAESIIELHTGADIDLSEDSPE